MNNNREFAIIRSISIAILVIIIILWNENSQLKQRVNACAWQIDVANVSIGYANETISHAHANAGSDYQTIESTLERLTDRYDLRENPCDKNFTGNLKNYPTQ
jgi:hypothetical protein